MEARRQDFEPLWRAGIQAFLEGIMTDSDSRLYNSYYEQYDLSMFSRGGLRFGNLTYPLTHSIVMRALATEYKNRPKVNFVVIGSNDQSKAAPFTALFNQVLADMNSDEEDFEVLQSRDIFGSSVVMVGCEMYNITVDDPVFDGEKYIYEEKDKVSKQVLYKMLDLRHVYLDEKCRRSSLSDCNYAQVDEYFSPAEFSQRFYSDAYDKEAVQKAAKQVVSLPQSEYNSQFDNNKGEFVRVTHCFDKIADRYHILAGEYNLINDVDAPIPRIAGRKGKEIPLALAVKYKIPQSPYGYADSHLISSFSRIKDLMRLMIMEITQKSAKPTITIDPLSAFDEQGFEWGQDFLRVSPNDFGQININPNLQSLYQLDGTTDSDITRVTGVDINDTQAAPEGETARKTMIRRESQNALLELGMELLTNSFYKRLYGLMQSDIVLHYGGMAKGGEKISVKTKGEMIDRGSNGKIIVEQVKGTRYFDMQPKDFDIEMDVEVELGNIATSKELEKALAGEGIASLEPFLAGVDVSKAIEYIQETHGMPDLRADAQKATAGTPEDIAKEGIPPEMLPPNEQIKMEAQNQQLTQQDGGIQPDTGQPATGQPV